jgi:hypothetical protein
MFVLVALTGVCSMGMVLGALVEAVNPQAPEVVLGPLLCPAGIMLDLKYSRSLGGGVRQTLVNCIDADGQIVVTRNGYLSFLWYGLFALPLLPLVYPIVVGLRRHNYPVQRRTAPQGGGFAGRTLERLTELETLREHGLLTEDEYQRKRNEILADL